AVSAENQTHFNELSGPVHARLIGCIRSSMTGTKLFPPAAMELSQFARQQIDLRLKFHKLCALAFKFHLFALALAINLTQLFKLLGSKSLGLTSLQEARVRRLQFLLDLSPSPLFVQKALN